MTCWCTKRVHSKYKDDWTKSHMSYSEGELRTIPGDNKEEGGSKSIKRQAKSQSGALYIYNYTVKWPQPFSHHRHSRPPPLLHTTGSWGGKQMKNWPPCLLLLLLESIQGLAAMAGAGFVASIAVAAAKGLAAKFGWEHSNSSFFLRRFCVSLRGKMIKLAKYNFVPGVSSDRLISIGVFPLYII